jgi:hypothetical protein
MRVPGLLVEDFLGCFEHFLLIVAGEYEYLVGNVQAGNVQLGSFDILWGFVFSSTITSNTSNLSMFHASLGFQIVLRISLLYH